MRVLDAYLSAHHDDTDEHLHSSLLVFLIKPFHLVHRTLIEIREDSNYKQIECALPFFWQVLVNIILLSLSLFEGNTILMSIEQQAKNITRPSRCHWVCVSVCSCTSSSPSFETNVSDTAVWKDRSRLVSSHRCLENTRQNENGGGRATFEMNFSLSPPCLALSPPRLLLNWKCCLSVKSLSFQFVERNFSIRRTKIITRLLGFPCSPCSCGWSIPTRTAFH